MRRFLTIALIALLPTLGGCALFQKLDNAFQVLTSASVSPQAVVVAVNSFDALEATATRYLRLVKCNGANGPVCRDPVISAKVIDAIQKGRIARNNLEQFANTHPGQLGSQGLYDALQTTISTIQDVLPSIQATGVVK